jgi:hypothetical protein
MGGIASKFHIKSKCFETNGTLNDSCVTATQKLGEEHSILVYYQDLFIKLDDFEDPLKGQVSTIDFIRIQNLLTNEIHSHVSMSPNNVELTDNNIIQNVFATDPEIEINYLTIEGETIRENERVSHLTDHDYTDIGYKIEFRLYKSQIIT